MKRLGLAALVLALFASLVLGWSPSSTLAVQPALPIRAAFYYPWYPETWGAGTNYHPTLGQYDSSTASVIQQHVAWMQSAGIQAGIASWWGQGSKTDSRFPALEANAGSAFKWTAYYEPEGTGDPSVAQIQSDLAYIRSHYVHLHPQWLRVNKKPVIFVYGDGNDGCGMADRWAQASAGRWYVDLKVFPGYASCANQPSSWHQYAPSSRADAQLPYSYSISPGFYKAGESAPRLARDVSAFTTAAQDMVASGAQWQLITTFNEWGEGTAIEPSTEWGTTYLDALNGSSSSSPPPTSPPPTSPPPPPTNAVVVIYMENHERSDIVGSSSAPYLNSFRAAGVDFTHYYGVTHPSLPNYLAFGNGSTDGKGGTDSITAGEISGTTLWNQLSAKGVPWRVYEESMPSACSSAVTSGNYALKHNPATPFAAVFNDKTLCANVQPYTASSPIVDGVNFIAPNLCNDMHDCSIATGDNWLKAHVPSMLASGATVVITWDEGSSGTNGGGNVYTAVDGPGITGSVDTATYNHYSLLAGVEKKFALPFLGAAATARPLPI